MKYLKFTFLFFLSIYSILSAQTAPAIEWQKSLGGSNGEEVHSIQQTSDGGYIAAGWSYSVDGDVTGNHGNSDYWIVKLDASGTIQWQKSLGGTSDENAYSIKQTVDGGYIVAGESSSTDGDVTGNHGNTDYWIVKLDASGIIQWQKSLGGSNQDKANSIQQTSDGGYIIAGDSYSTDGDVTGNHGNSDYWIVKLDPSGTIQWQKSLGGTSYEGANSIQQTSDGGYIVAGTGGSTNGDISINYGGGDFWIVKLDASGTIQWNQSLMGNLADTATSIQQTSDGGYIVAGMSNSTNSETPLMFGTSNYCVAKLDSNGNTLWQRYFGGSGEDHPYSTQQTSDGGYIVAGGTGSADGNITGNHGSFDYWILKLDTSGIIQWQKSLGGSSFDYAYSIQQTDDGGYILAGMVFSSDGNITGYRGESDAWIVKLSATQLNTAESSLINKPVIYPNPAKDFVHLDHLSGETVVNITDMSGRNLFNKKYSEEKININTSQFTNGVYMIQVQHKGKILLSEKLKINK
ncbi:T9SS type A sorting domain-containing protein [Chryseobacterium vrystaatense]|uniref:Por secretion system C-terminal sorting domain-containing protein n=1 Tax=Chryseobacterium vrystaatense TaxID=307480 RepID=A0A1M5LYS3_9FLAO|nr:T9SS type A sorting domain-containing protein [Chryseobacterium vrystaatense]SHG69809.1 Por secretion system C-terminal sorting domain-containing protein [Chryseobacterium vrystaatense]